MNAPRPLPVELTQKAEADLLALEKAERARVKDDITRLATGTLPLGQTKKLKGFDPPLWELKTGRHRLFFRPLTDKLLILRAVARKDLDRALRSFR